MQCASSTTTSETRTSASDAAQDALEALGRDVDQLELAARSARERVAALLAVERRVEHGGAEAGRASASTWSFMSEMSGLTTSTVPGRRRAGIWKVSDLPAPVGMTPMQSRPPSTASMMLLLPGTELVVAEDVASGRRGGEARRERQLIDRGSYRALASGAQRRYYRSNFSKGVTTMRTLFTLLTSSLLRVLAIRGRASSAPPTSSRRPTRRRRSTLSATQHRPAARRAAELNARELEMLKAGLTDAILKSRRRSTASSTSRSSRSSRRRAAAGRVDEKKAGADFATRPPRRRAPRRPPPAWCIRSSRPAPASRRRRPTR